MIKSLDNENFDEGWFSDQKRKIIKRKYFAIPLKSPSKFCGKNILTFLPEFISWKYSAGTGTGNSVKNGNFT